MQKTLGGIQTTRNKSSNRYNNLLESSITLTHTSNDSYELNEDELINGSSTNIVYEEEESSCLCLPL